MRLNPDCVRDVMLYVEENLEYNGSMPMNDIVNSLYSKYPGVDIIYSVEQLILKEWLIKRSIDSIIIKDIHPNGHDFLANTRTLSIWEEAKSKLQEKGIEATIEIMGILSKQIVKAKLGIDIF